MLYDQSGDLGRHSIVATERQLELQQIFEGRESPLLESRQFGLHSFHLREVRKCGSSPQPEGSLQGVSPADEVALGNRRPRLHRKCIEGELVALLADELQPVTAPTAKETLPCA